jgi:SH3-like domain-containing protein
MRYNLTKINRYIPALIILLPFLFLCIMPAASLAEMLSVKGEKVNLRSGPGKKYIVKWEYGDGFPLVVIKKKGKWIKVKDFEGDQGWIHKNLLVDEPRMIVKVNRSQNKSVNIRKLPGTNQKVVGKAYYGVVFTTIKQKSGWVNVKHDTGLKGWIKRSLLWGY